MRKRETASLSLGSRGISNVLLHGYQAGSRLCSSPTHCRALSRPTPELVAELRVTFSYLNQHPSLGLTFEAGRKHELSGYSDSYWAIKNSTSGWSIFWQNVPLVWGSRKQNCVALSSCEAEIIALSEAAKDMVISANSYPE